MSSYIWKKKVNEPEVILPARDQEVLDKYTRRMKRFDECIKVCCCWIGWDLLLELIPVVGKVISLIFAMSLYRLASTCDLPRSIKRRMLYHVSIDFLLGLIPILGILLNLLYRAHSKNARILRRFLYERAKKGSQKAESEALQMDQNINAQLSESTTALMESDRRSESMKNK